MLSKQRRITQAPSLALACCCAWVTAFLRMQQKRDAASPWQGEHGTERRLTLRHLRQGFRNLWCQVAPFHQLHGCGLVQIAACLWLPLIVQGCSALYCLNDQRHRVVGHLQICKHGPWASCSSGTGPVVATLATFPLVCLPTLAVCYPLGAEPSGRVAATNFRLNTPSDPRITQIYHR